MAIPSVKWASIELPKECGGLGVGNIMYKNIIMLFKWWWHYSQCEDTFRKRILMSIHNIKGLKASSVNFQSAKDGLWAQLLGNDDETVKVRSIVEDGLVLKVGNGTSIRFWLDKWCDGVTLKNAFPRLFSISTQQGSFINQMGYWGDGS